MFFILAHELIVVLSFKISLSLHSLVHLSLSLLDNLLYSSQAIAENPKHVLALTMLFRNLSATPVYSESLLEVVKMFHLYPQVVIADHQQVY